MSLGNNKKKSVNKAMEDVKKAILKKENKKPIKVKSKNIEEVLLLTDIYKDPNIFNSNGDKVSKFKANVKLIVEQDVNEWLRDNFSQVVINYTKNSIKSLNIKR
ncbi:MAG: hypothetical protein CMP15_02390 [Rickettsiales bacterium]|nr:hypothetical protein [Rickettsiales bacterium]|tara:strand:- start:1116 stop:1427 length:312 start_codon:yes stop_codon:yes gene_type:complete